MVKKQTSTRKMLRNEIQAAGQTCGSAFVFTVKTSFLHWTVTLGKTPLELCFSVQPSLAWHIWRCVCLSWEQQERSRIDQLFSQRPVVVPSSSRLLTCIFFLFVFLLCPIYLTLWTSLSSRNSRWASAIDRDRLLPSFAMTVLPDVYIYSQKKILVWNDTFLCSSSDFRHIQPLLCLTGNQDKRW